MLIYIFGAIWNLKITFHSVQYTHPLSWLHEDFHSSLGFYKTIFFSTLLKNFAFKPMYLMFSDVYTVLSNIGSGPSD